MNMAAQDPAPSAGGVILLIAWGNDLRRDDGAGLYLAAQLERRWRRQGLTVRRLTVPQPVPELATAIAAPEVAAVVFVDTRVADAADEGRVGVMPLTAATAAAPILGHQLDPALLLAYAALLRAEPLPPAWLVTVPGFVFDHGRGLSPAVRAVIARCLEAWERDEGSLTPLTAWLRRHVAAAAT
jgi:hydrogenase maturation protease